MSVDINYFSFSPSRADLRWLNFPEDISQLRKKYKDWRPGKEKADVTLTPEQDDLFDNASADYLTGATEYNEEKLLLDLKSIDLYYGSVPAADYIDKNEGYILEAMAQAAGLEVEKEEYGIYGHCPTKKGWIDFYTGLNEKMMSAVIAWVQKETGWGEEDSRFSIEEYLRFVRPVVKDLKNTPDAVFISYYDGFSYPPSAENLLLGRAKNHAVQFKGLISPVL